METWNLLISKRIRPKGLRFNKLILVGAEGFEPQTLCECFERHNFDYMRVFRCIVAAGPSRRARCVSCPISDSQGSLFPSSSLGTNNENIEGQPFSHALLGRNSGCAPHSLAMVKHMGSS
jgi:hypothetical protein